MELVQSLRYIMLGHSSLLYKTVDSRDFHAHVSICFTKKCYNKTSYIVTRTEIQSAYNQTSFIPRHHYSLCHFQILFIL
jgi:hypothetical protein